MTGTTIRICGLTLVDAPPTDKAPVLARFSCEVSGVRLNNCVLVRFRNGSLRIFPPRAPGQQPEQQAILFVDKTLLDAVTEAAHRAYVAFGGRE